MPSYWCFWFIVHDGLWLAFLNRLDHRRLAIEFNRKKLSGIITQMPFPRRGLGCEVTPNGGRRDAKSLCDVYDWVAVKVH